jgi:hypothetical protein
MMARNGKSSAKAVRHFKSSADLQQQQVAVQFI